MNCRGGPPWPPALKNMSEDDDQILADQRHARIVRQRNIVLIVMGLVVLLVAILIVWRVRRSKSEAETEVTPTVSVKVAKAEKETIAAPVTAVGTIWPREKADVGAKISAQIKSMSLLKNKLVRAGEVIAVLEARDLQAQRAEAIAALNEARASERSLVTGTIGERLCRNTRTQLGVQLPGGHAVGLTRHPVHVVKGVVAMPVNVEKLCEVMGV